MNLYFLKPRSFFAEVFEKTARNYDASLLNSSAPQDVVQAILNEKNRLRSLFEKVCPEYLNNLSIVVVNNTTVDTCSVFLFKNHLYILVSAAFIGRPYDHPSTTESKAWEWIAQHEAVHVKNNHDFILFLVKKFFIFCSTTALSLKLLVTFCAGTLASDNYFYAYLSLIGFSWLVFFVSSFYIECKADVIASQKTDDIDVLIEAKEYLKRVKSQVREISKNPLNRLILSLHRLIFPTHRFLKSEQI